MKLKKTPVIINCDTGIDDAVALIIALKSKNLDIKLITTDVGNVEPNVAAKNTLNVLELIDAPQIPVACSDGTYFEKERPHVSVHGKYGLGDFKFEKNNRKIEKKEAVEKIYEILKNSYDKITIISISPATNISKLIRKYPDVKNKIEKVVLMAGSVEKKEKGKLPYPEFNVSSDPESAKFLLESGLKLEFVPMEMGHTAYLTYQDIFKTKRLNYVGSVLEKIFRPYKDGHVTNGAATHDGCAVAYLIKPKLFKTKPVNVEIRYYEKLDTGVMIMDFEKKPNATTCVSVSVRKFKKLYFKSIKNCK